MLTLLFILDELQHWRMEKNKKVQKTGGHAAIN